MYLKIIQFKLFYTNYFVFVCLFCGWDYSCFFSLCQEVTLNWGLNFEILFWRLISYPSYYNFFKY